MSGRKSPADSRWSRRQFLGLGAVAGVGAIGGIGIEQATRSGRATQPDTPAELFFGDSAVAFRGQHQAGVTAPPQACVKYCAFDLDKGADRDAIARLMRLLTDDSEVLMAGKAPLSDSEPELALTPANLTITVGVGPELVRVVAGDSAVPAWLRPLPAYRIDELRDEWAGGDLVVELAADEPLTVAHAARTITKSIRSIATPRWVQDGFRRAHGTAAPTSTPRNLFGQIDGTVNPTPGTSDFDDVVWAHDGWLAGGTSLVLRRIAMDLDKWDEVDKVGREASVGRRLSDGAPLTGHAEHDEPDFEAVDGLGFTVIPDFSHMRRARSDNARERIYRRVANYEFAVAGGRTESGLIFASYQADPLAQYHPLQARLAELDMLNEWTTPIGSAVFAILPGARDGELLGAALLD